MKPAAVTFDGSETLKRSTSLAGVADSYQRTVLLYKHGSVLVDDMSTARMHYGWVDLSVAANRR